MHAVNRAFHFNQESGNQVQSNCKPNTWTRLTEDVEWGRYFWLYLTSTVARGSNCNIMDQDDMNECYVLLKYMFVFLLGMILNTFDSLFVTMGKLK